MEPQAKGPGPWGWRSHAEGQVSFLTEPGSAGGSRRRELGCGSDRPSAVLPTEESATQAAAQLCPPSAGPSPRAEGQIGNHSACSGCRGSSPPAPPSCPRARPRPPKDLAPPVPGRLQGSQEKSPAVARAWLLLRHTLWGSCQAGARHAGGARGPRMAVGLAWSVASWRREADSRRSDGRIHFHSPFRCSRCSRQSLGTCFSRVIFLGGRVLCVLLPHTSAFFFFFS